MDEYQKKGYENRAHYIEELAYEYGLDFESVYFLSQMLGEEEDFDGLLVALEEYLVV